MSSTSTFTPESLSALALYAREIEHSVAFDVDVTYYKSM